LKALVLAAGKGERLKPLTDTTPKPLLEVGGRLLIHYPLMMLKRGGVTQITINVHHLGAMIEASLKRGGELGLNIRYSREAVLSGTGGPLVELRDYFGDETFVIANSDTILDLDLARMVAYHCDRRALATIALNRPPNLDYYSRLEIDGGGEGERMIRRMRLLKRQGRPDFDDYPAGLAAEVAASLSGFMYCGVCVCEPTILAMTPAAPPFSLMGHVFGPMVAKGMRVAGYVHRGYFRTVDDLEGYERLRAEFAKSPPPFAT